MAARGTAQQGDRMRRVGVLIRYAESDPSARSFAAAFAHSLEQSAWKDVQNVSIEYRWAGGDVSLTEKFAKELVEEKPDVIIGGSTDVAQKPLILGG
jgi:putative ABC transport system substrate-binding protein